jgi:hypothetical protein
MCYCVQFEHKELEKICHGVFNLHACSEKYNLNTHKCRHLDGDIVNEMDFIVGYLVKLKQAPLRHSISPTVSPSP